MTDAASFAAPPVSARRIALLVNPAAGRHDGRDIEKLAAALRVGGAEVDVVTSRAPGHLATVVAGLAVGTLAVAGGDGTINEVIGALVERAAPRPRLAVVPQGTANVLAHEYSLPNGVDAIAAAILAGRTRPLHLGRATDRAGRQRPFFLMTSVGFDAAVVHAVERRVKRRFKKLAFLVTALKRGSRDLPEATLSVTAPGGEVTRLRAALAIVTKASHYGGPFVLTRATAMERPGLHVVALKSATAFALIAAAFRLALGRLEGSTDVVSLPATRVRLSSISRLQELPVQIDGEPWGHTTVEVEAIDITVDVVVG